MEKKTIIAVVLAVGVIIVGMLIQSVFFPQQPRTAAPPAPQSAETAAEQPQAVTEGEPAQVEEARPQASPDAAAPAGPAPAVGEATQIDEQGPRQEESLTIETDVFIARFTNRGGELTSLKLKEFTNPDGSLVDMVFSRDSGLYPFSLRFGDHNAPRVDALFHHELSLTGSGVTFYRTFVSPSGVPFTVRKSFAFQQSSYMMELFVEIENSVNDYPDLRTGGYAYTLGIEPQIGPAFEKLDARSESRDFMSYSEGAKSADRVKVPKEGLQTIDRRVSWVALNGKYFSLIALPGAVDYRITLDTRPVEGLSDRSAMYFSRPEIRSSSNKDQFRFYMGPKKRDILARFNSEDRNPFGLSGMNLEKILDLSFLRFGWLADILSHPLRWFYALIPNYGVAIILLTLLIKLILWPLTHKSFESTAKMQALQPKMNEVREKYKSNPQKMNQEIAALYKKEGVSPLGGCLPLLLQMPILFAMYTLLGTHFELRSAVFIPGWINDLSSPESVLEFNPVKLLFFELSAIRVLPFVMLVTTFIQTRFTQSPESAGSSGANMKMMTYAMPIMFFFILYNLPSGLVLYWTMQNVLSIFQQLYTNSRRARMAAAGPQQGPPPRSGGKRPPGGSKPPKRRK
ncbi:MAG: membrane protein insertase YidC [Spirochaetales bacterium]|nr:membrane protein insertase YidC [Spirochaetales bacterium]